jgi:hypothetical protein
MGMRSRIVFVAVGIICLVGTTAGATTDAQFLIGGATTNISPEGPVALAGQMYTRFALQVTSPLMATALALESREKDKTLDQAIMVSCDLLRIPDGILEDLRRELQDRLPDFEVKKLFLSATHTHTGPVLQGSRYDIPDEGVVQPRDYLRFLKERLSDLVVRAWQCRKPGAVSWGLGHAAVGQNRRAVYADGHAEMYGRTDVPQFRGMEGYEDHDVDVLFFWGGDKKLMAVAVNLACPAQEAEAGSSIDADFWHQVREKLRRHYSPDLLVLGWIGAAGDQSPHLMYRRKAEERMLQLRGLNRLEEIARRICLAVDEVYEACKNDLRTDIPLLHRVERIKLPVRRVTEEELANAKSQVEALSRAAGNQRIVSRYQQVVERYERQKTTSHYDMELHVIRLGDIAICTNPFELFTDFGIQIKARSRALQTFVIQLAGSGGYVPPEKAVRGGGYSATVESNVVGPEGGQVLADKTVESINSLWTLHP